MSAGVSRQLTCQDCANTPLRHNPANLALKPFSRSRAVPPKSYVVQKSRQMQETHPITHSAAHFKACAVTFRHIAGRSPHLKLRPGRVVTTARAGGDDGPGGWRRRPAKRIGGGLIIQGAT